jgi:type I restriction enzyme S subunit
MSEWKEIKLGELLNVITKGTTPPKGIGFVDKGINYVKSDAIGYDRKLDKTKIAHINEETHQSFKRSQLAENDILFSMAGIYLGKNAIVTKDILPANTNQALAILRLNQEKANPTYVSLYLSQQVMIDYVNNMSGQSAQPNVNFEEIKSIEIKLPPISEQTAIASVLSSLDDKIDLLHSQNYTLEKMAETLFRQWFVEEAKEEWKDVELGSVVETTSGGTPSRTNIRFYENGTIHWVKSKELNGSFILETEEMITEEALRKSSAKILPVNSILIAMYGATVGEYAIIAKEMTCNQAVCALIPNKNYPYTYLFLLIKHNREELINMAVGSAQQNISQLLIKQLSVLDCIEQIERFNLVVEPLFIKIKSYHSQIRTLKALRDTLLLKLMSGEVKVEM